MTKDRPGARETIYTLIDKERQRQQEKHAGKTFENAANSICAAYSAIAGILRGHRRRERPGLNAPANGAERCSL